MTITQVDAGRRHNGEKNKAVSCFIFHPKLSNTVPRTETSLDLKLARKASKRPKRDLRGLWDTLAHESTVVRTSLTNSVKKEPVVPEVKVRNSDITKIGSNEIQTFGNTHKDFLSHATKSHRKSLLSTQKSWKKGGRHQEPAASGRQYIGGLIGK